MINSSNVEICCLTSLNLLIENVENANQFKDVSHEKLNESEKNLLI